jgi:SAM-dependent methyltransferase
MQVDYFGHSRTEIEPLLPPSADRVLEIGCSAGGTLAWLKARWPEAEFVGVDGNPDVLEGLRAIAPRSFIHDLERPLPEIGQFDLILALDILEHLKHPEEALADLASRLKHSGRIIVSVPNISHFSVLSDLILKRKFDYRDAGILDRTHLRFFTEHSALSLMQKAGLAVTSGLVNGLDGKKSKIVNTLSFGRAFHYLVKQYIMAGLPGDAHEPVVWKSSNKDM